MGLRTYVYMFQSTGWLCTVVRAVADESEVSEGCLFRRVRLVVLHYIQRWVGVRAGHWVGVGTI